MKYRHSTTHLLPEVEAKYPSIVDIEMNQNRTIMIGSALYREIKRNVAMIKQRHLCVERGAGEKRGGERGEGEDAAITDDYPTIGQSRPGVGARRRRGGPPFALSVRLSALPYARSALVCARPEIISARRCLGCFSNYEH